MSQEWDWEKVLHEVRLMGERLDAFRDDLLAAANGGKLTKEQCEFARDSVVMASACELYLRQLHVDATSETAEDCNAKYQYDAEYF